MTWLSKRLHWVFFVATASLFYLPLASRSLSNSGEVRIAEAARSLLHTGEWLVHPPLMYWLTAGSFALFGETAFAARFWPATFGLLTVMLVFFLGRKWMSLRAGLLSGCVLATSLLFFGLTQYLALEMALTFWLTLSLYAASGMLTERLPEKVRRFSTLLAFAMAGGFITKGFAGLLLPVIVMLLAVAYTRSWSQLSKISLREVFLCAGLLIAPWIALVAFKDKSYLVQFLLLSSEKGAPVYYFLPGLLAAFLPWSVFLPFVFGELLKHRGTELKRDPVKALLFLWAFFITLIYSLLRPSLVGGILPVLPALALLCGDSLDQVLELPRSPEWFQRGLLMLAFLFSVGVILLKIPQATALFSHPAAIALHGSAAVLCLVMSAIVMIFVGVWGMRQPFPALGGIVIAQALLFGALAMLAPLVHADDVTVDDLNLPKLVLPPEPPRGVRLQDPVVKKDEWRGVQCGVPDLRVVTFHDSAKWSEFWQKALAPFSEKLAKTPEVDFTKDMVVGVFLGDRSTPNYEVIIKKVRFQEAPGQEKILVVTYKEVKKMQGVFTPPFLIQPFHLKKVPNFEGEIKFEPIKP